MTWVDTDAVTSDWDEVDDPGTSYLLMEDGGLLLLETGGKIILEPPEDSEWNNTSKPSDTWGDIAKPSDSWNDVTKPSDSWVDE